MCETICMQCQVAQKVETSNLILQHHAQQTSLCEQCCKQHHTGDPTVQSSFHDVTYNIA